MLFQPTGVFDAPTDWSPYKCVQRKFVYNSENSSYTKSYENLEPKTTKMLFILVTLTFFIHCTFILPEIIIKYF